MGKKKKEKDVELTPEQRARFAEMFRKMLQELAKDLVGPDRATQRSLQRNLDVLHGDFDYGEHALPHHRQFIYDNAEKFVKQYCLLYCWLDQEFVVL